MTAPAEEETRRTQQTESRPAGIWRNADFVKFWTGMNVSLLGTQIASLAYPLTAVLILQATPSQMGMLRATVAAAAVVMGPFAGVLADRVRRRPILIGTDLGLAVVALSIPIAFSLGLLRIELLYVVQFLAGALTIMSEVTLMSYLPTLVRREQLLGANSQIQASNSAITIVGPGLAGVLVQMLTAPVVIIFDAFSYLLSALFLWLVRTPEPEPARAEEKRASVWAEIGEGLRFVYGHRLLRPLAEGIAIHFLFMGMVYSIFVLYAVRELGMSPAQFGIVLAALGPGFLVGALLAPRAAKRFGVGRVMVWVPLLTATGTGLIPLASGGMPAIMATIAAAHFLSACGIQLHGVNFLTLRQSLTPHRLQGRMSASFRFVNLFASGVGALIAGWLGETVGLRATMAVAACGLYLPLLRLIFSPIRHLREQPTAEHPDDTHRHEAS
jgi:MFS family permease